MNIHEYQARDLLRRFGLPVPAQRVATSPDEVADAAREFAAPVVVKAQVHAGGRGKAGGVKLASSPEEARERAEAILGMHIKDLEVRKVMVAEAVDLSHEYYLAILMDRAECCPVIVASTEGGMDIEEVAETKPDAIRRLDPCRFLGTTHGWTPRSGATDAGAAQRRRVARSAAR